MRCAKITDKEHFDKGIQTNTHLYIEVNYKIRVRRFIWC